MSCLNLNDSPKGVIMEQFLSNFQKLDIDNLDLLDDIYSKDVVFIDPAHKMEGLTELTSYFNNLYKKIAYISFDFHNPVQEGNNGYVQWKMTFSHKSIKGGKEIFVDGATYIKFGEDNKVIYHRDHFDLGSMVYQYIPLLGSVINFIKRRIGQ